MRYYIFSDTLSVWWVLEANKLYNIESIRLEFGYQSRHLNSSANIRLIGSSRFEDVIILKSCEDFRSSAIEHSLKRHRDSAGFAALNRLMLKLSMTMRAKTA